MATQQVEDRLRAMSSSQDPMRRGFEMTVNKASDVPKGRLLVNIAVELGVHDGEIAAKVKDSLLRTEQ